MPCIFTKLGTDLTVSFNLNPIGLSLGRIEAPDSAFADQEEDIRGGYDFSKCIYLLMYMHLMPKYGGGGVRHTCWVTAISRIKTDTK